MVTETLFGFDRRRSSVARTMPMKEPFLARRADADLDRIKWMLLLHERGLHSHWHRRKNRFLEAQLKKHTLKEVTLKQVRASVLCVVCRRRGCLALATLHGLTENVGCRCSC